MAAVYLLVGCLPISRTQRPHSSVCATLQTRRPLFHKTNQMSRAVVTRIKCRLVITSGRNGRRKADRHWTGVWRRGYEEAGHTIPAQSDGALYGLQPSEGFIASTKYALKWAFSYSCTRIWIKIRMHKLNSNSLNTFTAIVDLSRFNNSRLKSPTSTLVDLTFQSRALCSFSLNQLRNLSL